MTESRTERYRIIFKTRPIDVDVTGNTTPIERTHNQVAADWIEKTLLPKDFVRLYSEDIISYLTKINGLLNGNQKGEIRSDIALIKKEKLAPMLFEIDGMRAYLKGEPSDLETYEELINDIVAKNGTEAAKNETIWFDKVEEIFSNTENTYYKFISKYYAISKINNHEEIKLALEEEIDQVKSEFVDNPIKAAAMLHMSIVDIHPWLPDANGRTARHGMNWVLKKGGYPAIFIHRNKAYIDAMREALDKKDNTIFERYIEEQICKATELMNNEEFKEGDVMSDFIESCKSECQEKFKSLLRKFGI